MIAGGQVNIKVRTFTEFLTWFQWNVTTPKSTISLIFRRGQQTNSTIVHNIADNIKNNGAYSYTIPPTTPPGNDYLIEIIVGAIANISDVGKNYSMTPQLVIHAFNSTNQTIHHNSTTGSPWTNGTSSINQPTDGTAANDNHNSTPVGLIAGICVGSVIFIGSAIGFVYWLFRRRSRRGPSEKEQDMIKLSSVGTQEREPELEYSGNLREDHWNDIPCGALRPMDE